MLTLSRENKMADGSNIISAYNCPPKYSVTGNLKVRYRKNKEKLGRLKNCCNYPKI